jgi:hypothetical protein
MRRPIHAVLVFCAAVFFLAVPSGVSADETDNFTCRARLSRDSLAILDSWVNAQIQQALARANRRGSERADEAGVIRELQKAVGGSVPDPFTLVPHSRFERWIDGQSQVDRCHLAFEETIYGARPYNQPWLYPFLGRTVLVADSILLSGHIVGVDKINHFIREGLTNWRAVSGRGEDISDVLSRELDPALGGWNWTEAGIKGMALTGVLSYADVAAGYSGFRFWEELLQPRRERSMVAYDAALGRFVQVRNFTFAAYVTDAWDEGVNYSTFHPVLRKEVEAAVQARGMTMPVRDCRPLADLPAARLYVNPACLVQ